MFKISLGLAFYILVVGAATDLIETTSTEDPENTLEDFSFYAPDDYYFIDDMMPLNNMDGLDGDLSSDEPPKANQFTVKEQKIKSTVLKAFTNRALKRKFSEILPILKVMSSSQKLAMAALITAQVSAQNGDELSLKQVEDMFGNRPDLILPLTLDIANLVKTAGEHKPPPPPTPENESILNMQLLRRSYSSDHEIPSTSFDRRAKSRKIRDVSNQLVTPDGILVQNHPTMEKLPKSSSLTSNERSYHERKLNMTAFHGPEDQLAMPSHQSYQIVKPDAPPPDQDLEKTLRSYIKQNLTLEEIEKLSFSQLNGTTLEKFDPNENDTDYDDDEDYGDMNENLGKHNSTNGEDAPQAEKLISILVRNGAQMATKSKSSFRKRRPILPANGLSTGMEMKNCEKFGNLCLRTPEYPMEQIMGSIRRNRHAMTALLAEYRDKFAETHLDTNLMYLKRRNDEAKQPGGMCPSIVRYARPQKARSASGEVKYIVNTGQHSQTLRLEKCTSPQESCTYLTDSYKSRCVQIFNYHRLLSWDKVRGLHVDIFKVPTCCSCHVDGYRETYPPFFGKPSPSTVSLAQSSYKPEFKPSISLLKEPTKYSFPSLTNNDDEDDESDEEEEIVEEYRPNYSSGLFSKYTPLKTNYNFDTSFLNSDTFKYTPFESTASSKKILKHDNTPFIPSSPVLESFLSPPTHDYSNLATSSYGESSIKYRDPFKQRGPTNGLQSSPTTVVKRKRRPLSRLDQLIEESELKTQKYPFENYEVTTIRPKRVQIVRALSTKSTTPTTRRPPTTTKTTTTTTIRPSTIRFRPRFTTTATTTSSKPTRHLDYNNKRVNYNYHPIIDFFEEGEFDDDTDDDIASDNHRNFNDRIDRIGTIIRLDRNKWQPVVNTRRRLRM